MQEKSTQVAFLHIPTQWKNIILSMELKPKQWVIITENKHPLATFYQEVATRLPFLSPKSFFVGLISNVVWKEKKSLTST